MMVCALLVNIMDHRKCFMQTLIGLGYITQYSCSMFHIRQHGNLWARLRTAISEISFWRLPFDNLDFRMKFAKKLTVANGSGTLKRMLHLLTSQVTFRSNVSSEPKYDRSSSCELKESHFKISHSRDQWTKYCKAVFYGVPSMSKIQVIVKQRDCVGGGDDTTCDTTKPEHRCSHNQ